MFSLSWAEAIELSDEFIPLSVPNLKGRELELVSNAIRDEWVSTAGPYVEEFESKLAEYVGVDGAVSCQNGTAGLHLALLLSGVTAKDAVIVPALTFIAAVNPVKYIGAEPIFMDCDASLCMDPEKLEHFCREECDFDGSVLIHRASGRPVKTLVVVHVFGNMADMERILATASEFNMRVVEDATEALGTRYTDGPLAGRFAGTMGDFGVYSFNGNKIITTGGGGMLVAKDAGLLARAKHLSTQAKSDVVYFEHDEIGYNYRMTNLQAAMGIAQLEQLESFIEAKERNYQRYCELAQDVKGLDILGFRSGTRSNKWFYSLVCDEQGAFDRDDIIARLSAQRIQARPVWGIICDQKPYEGSIEYKVEKARRYRERIVNVPCSTNLALEDVGRVMGTIKECSSDRAE